MKTDCITDRKVFHTIMRPVGDDHKIGKFIQITCKKCGTVGEASIRGHVRLISHEAGCQLFRKQGWKPGTARTKDVCPDCANPAPKPVKVPVVGPEHLDPPTDIVTPASYGGQCGMIKTPPDPPPMQIEVRGVKFPFVPVAKIAERIIEIVKEDRPMAVEPPREPTRDENRLIRDKLFDEYDEDRQCYRGDWTDQAIAEALDKPRAWVTSVREQFFGPECNEQEELSRKEITLIRQEALALETKLTKVFGEFADQLSALSARLTKAEGKLPKKAV